MRWSLVVASAIISATGCGGAPGGGDDPDAARAALGAALDAWKEGKAPESLLELSPAVHVADYRWEAGFKLKDYKVAESSATSGYDRRYPVQLWLTSAKGKDARERAVYNVATRPSVTVVRDPES